MQPLAAERQQTILVTPTPTGVVYGNEDYVIRLLLNMLDNAIRYSPVGGQVTLSCRRSNASIESPAAVAMSRMRSRTSQTTKGQRR